MPAGRSPQRAPLPGTLQEFKLWLDERVPMPTSRRSEVIRGVTSLLEGQRLIWEESKREAVQALSEGFAAKISGLNSELHAKEANLASVARYFEELVADLTEKSHQDPKTKLMNYNWFLERLSSFLALEQRARWCAIGVVDINAFKWFNDTLGHAVGDQIIERVAQILSIQIRSLDLLAADRRGSLDLHARFGGDEFCFLVPFLPGSEAGVQIATRFKRAVEDYDWALEHAALAARPVRVDVGVVCLELGPTRDRRAAAPTLASELIQWADRLMYRAKAQAALVVHPVSARVENGRLLEITEGAGVGAGES